MFQLDSTVYFVTLTISGIFSIIFSVAFAYVSDVTEESGIRRDVNTFIIYVNFML